MEDFFNFAFCAGSAVAIIFGIGTFNQSVIYKDGSPPARERQITGLIFLGAGISALVLGEYLGLTDLF